MAFYDFKFDFQILVIIQKRVIFIYIISHIIMIYNYFAYMVLTVYMFLNYLSFMIKTVLGTILIMYIN